MSATTRLLLACESTLYCYISKSFSLFFCIPLSKNHFFSIFLYSFSHHFTPTSPTVLADFLLTLHAVLAQTISYCWCIMLHNCTTCAYRPHSWCTPFHVLTDIRPMWLIVGPIRSTQTSVPFHYLIRGPSSLSQTVATNNPKSNPQLLTTGLGTNWFVAGQGLVNRDDK